MTRENRTEDRDAVLLAFQEACDRPTADQIIEWVRRYPQFADDIRAHAAVSRDWAAHEGLPAEAPDESMLARGFSRVLSAIYDAQQATKSNESAAQFQSFSRMMSERETEVPRLARELDIKRSVLADLFNGGMLPPVGKRLTNAIVDKLATTREAFDAALKAALEAPRLGHAKANETPTIIPRKYEEIIRDSGMTPERIQFWLGEDD
jgi:hypothetical protein